MNVLELLRPHLHGTASINETGKNTYRLEQNRTQFLSRRVGECCEGTRNIKQRGIRSLHFYKSRRLAHDFRDRRISNSELAQTAIAILRERSRGRGNCFLIGKQF